MSEFQAFYEADSDRPGLIILDADHGDRGDSRDAEFWRIATEQAWEEEWWYGDDDSHPFDETLWADVESEFRAWAVDKIESPVWRWYTWRPQPDEDAEPSHYLEHAEPGEDGAFCAALVIFKSATP